MIRKRSFFLCLVLFAALVLQFSLFAPDELEVRNPTEFLQVEDWNQEVQQSMENILLIESEEGKKVWDLRAVSAQALRETNAWAMVDVKAVFYASDGVEYEVASGLTEYDSSSKRMKFSNKVRVSSSNNYFFETDEILYDPDRENLVGNKPVRISAFPSSSKKYSEFRSQEVVVDLKTNIAQFLGRVTSSDLKDGNRELGLDTNNLILNENANKASFPSPVNFHYEGMLLSGKTGEMLYDPKTKKLQKLELGEEVKVESENKKALAGKLLLEFAKEQIILEEEPRLIQKEDELIGKRIIFQQAGKTLKIEGAKAFLNSSSGGPQVLDD